MSGGVWLVLYYIHLGLFSASSAIYGLWAVRWARRRRWVLAAVHGFVAVIVLVVVWEFLVPLTVPGRAAMLFRRNFFDVMWSASVVVLPAVARLLELRREAAQDARAELVQDVLAEEIARSVPTHG